VDGVFERRPIPNRVDFGVRHDARQGGDERLVEVGFVVVALEIFGGTVDAPELRRELAQPAECPRVLRGQLVIDAPHRIPRRLLSLRGVAELRPGGERARPRTRHDQPLDADEEVQLVAHDRAADREAPLGFANIRFRLIEHLVEEVPLGERLAGPVVERRPAERVGARLGDRVDHGARRASVLGVELAREDLHFLN